MDLQMPVMNGCEATEKIWASGMERIEELPIIAMTADVFAGDVKNASLAEMNGHPAKPISMGQLEIALSNGLQWKRKTGKVQIHKNYRGF